MHCDTKIIVQRKRKVILLHDNARPYVAKVVKIYYRHFNGKSYHTPRPPDYAPLEYHLF